MSTPALSVLIPDLDSPLIGRTLEALAAQGAPGPDIEVLVSDVVLAGALSGVQLAHAAAERRPGLPVVLISGYPGEALSHSGIVEGEYDLLQKPFSHQDLAARIQAAVRRGRREEPDAWPIGA